VRLRREILIELLARAVAVVVPVFAILAIDGSLDSGRGFVLGLVASALFLTCTQAGFRANATDLLALGPFVAAARGTIYAVVILSALDLWLGGPDPGLGSLFLGAGLVLTLVTLTQSLLDRYATAKRRVLIVGRSGGAPELVAELQLLRQPPFEVAGVIDDDGAHGWPAGVSLLGRLEDLSDVIQTERPDLVVVALGKNRPAIFGHLLDCASSGFRVLEIAQFAEHAFGRVPVRDLSRAWFMSILHLYQRPYSRFTKRTFDLVGAAIVLVVTLPILPVVALLVRLTTGPVILRQTRVGEHGNLFTMYKFRTMRPGAEAPGRAVWATKGDTRATRFGQFMRRVRLDEIPQLWNVLLGDMSIVGPRPERPEFLEELEDKVPYWTRRQLLKPGITGWAQIRRGYTADMTGSTEKLSYDFWYLRHRTLLVDLAICLHTFAVIVRGAQHIVPQAELARLPLPAPSTNGHHGQVADAPAVLAAAGRSRADVRSRFAGPTAPGNGYSGVTDEPLPDVTPRPATV
jgi:exopolysaccharide biosynthesis polyprenyl glycosylphosphotransferase